MEILHIDLKPIGNEYAEFRYFWKNPTDFQPQRRSLAEIEKYVQKADTDYYTRVPQDYATTGQVLYNWLDGSDRILQSQIEQHWRKGIVLAISASERLAHLPWEILHDGQQFLVARQPAIVPVRWVRDGSHQKLTVQQQPQNRALNALFMASAPRGMEPELNFEAEEGRILEATKRTPVDLRVEESGWLEELGYVAQEYESGKLDIVHLTGHATTKDGKPCFITETEFGDPDYSSAEDIAENLQFELPRLVFLSGCRTGYLGEAGAVPSMAEALLQRGATAVLGWGNNVRDTDASAASAKLYESLSAGKKVTEALALTYQELLRTNSRDWHLLRLYVAETLPGALVMRGRKPRPRPTAAKQFVDPEQKLEVATRENFVGRRRQLQNCLRVLKMPDGEVGVLIYGGGGLGKSTIASRLCDRLSNYQPIVWRWQIDESSLVDKLADKVKNSQQRQILQASTEELKYRLRDVFQALDEPGEKPFVLVFDEFEWNVEPRGGKYILKPEVARIFMSLVWAIQDANTDHRIIITCRYDFEADVLQSFYKQPLEAFRKSELQKFLSRLANFDPDEIGETFRNRALQLADGNPRLLEWLNDEVLSARDLDTQLSQLESHPDDWKGKIIWSDLYEQIDPPLGRILSYCLVFNIPVPMSALEAVCQWESDYQSQLNRAIGLGLIEVSPEPDESRRLYRVSRILPQIIPTIQLPEAPEVYSLYRKASEALSQCWGNRDNKSEERWREIFRLLFADKENPQRFRQGFHKMLAFLGEADRAYESEFRQVAEEIVEDNLYTQLETYLQQGKWREADEETAFIFYQVMVSNGYEDWEELLDNFPSQILKELDRLWVSSSDGHFGFSIQKQIWEGVGGHRAMGGHRADYQTWEKFGEQVGWYDREKDEWIAYRSLPFTTTTAKPAALPNFCFRMSPWTGVFWLGRGVGVGRVGGWGAWGGSRGSPFFFQKLNL